MYFTQKKIQFRICAPYYRFVADRRSGLANKMELSEEASHVFEGRTENSSVCLISLSIVNMN